MFCSPPLQMQLCKNVRCIRGIEHCNCEVNVLYTTKFNINDFASKLTRFWYLEL